jgi:hypothetical protein
MENNNEAIHQLSYQSKRVLLSLRCLTFNESYPHSILIFLSVNLLTQIQSFFNKINIIFIINTDSATEIISLKSSLKAMGTVHTYFFYIIEQPPKSFIDSRALDISDLIYLYIYINYYVIVNLYIFKYV